MGLKKFEEVKEAPIEATEPKADAKKEVAKKEPQITKTEKPKLSLSEESVMARVNAAREEFQGEQKKQKKLNYFVTIAMVVILVGAFIMVMATKDYSFLTWIGISLMVICLIGSYVVTNIMKKKLSSKANKYIDKLFLESTSYVYGDKGNKNLNVQPLGKLVDSDFFEGHFYSNLKGTKSRNLATFERNGLKYVSCDLAANTLVKNRMSPKFLGKFYKVTFDGNYEHTTVLQMKGGNLSVKIDDVDGVNLIEENDKYIIYSDDAEAKKIINGPLLNILSKIKITEPVVDVILSIKGNTVRVGIDYVDSFLDIPVDKDFDFFFTKKSAEDFVTVVEIVETVLKNVNKKTTK